MSETKRYDLEGVLWREYDFQGRVYLITNPIAFWHREGGETHRVLDDKGVVHIVPAPGHFGCVLRYKKADGFEPVKF
jgi:hypothetical protein